MPNVHMPRFVVGDKVAYSVQFLTSIGMCHSNMAHARGVVTAVKPLSKATTLVSVDWDRDMPSQVNTYNLAKVGLNRRFANVD